MQLQENEAKDSFDNFRCSLNLANLVKHESLISKLNENN